MKKVLILAAAFALFAAPAMAAITGTAHDLSATTGSGVAGNDYDEICVYCHTPHGAAAAGFAPLWNRVTVAATAIYGGVDINATYDINSYNASDAPLCLSCHDGTNLTTALNNPPNSGGVMYTGPAVGADANLGTDLSNDHPIGFNYEAVNALDAEIRTLADAQTNGIQFFGGTSKDMWCSSCHDVHDNTNTPFLAASNISSGLCLDCHIK